MNKYERLQAWANKLTEQEAKDLLPTLVDELITSEMVSFHSDSLAPYWHHSGDSLIEGQKTHEDD